MRALLIVAVAAAGLIPRPAVAQFPSCQYIADVVIQDRCNREIEQRQRDMDRFTALERAVEKLQAQVGALQAARPVAPAR